MSPNHSAGNTAFIVARTARDGLALELQLAAESMRNGWATPAAAAPAPPPVRVSSPVAPRPAPCAELFPLAGPPAPFAPASGPVRLDGTRDRIWVHEACHAVVARRLGAHVVQVLVYQESFVPGLSGFVEHVSGPECLTARAILAASGPACDELLGYGSGTGAYDRRQVAGWAREHQHRTGRPLPVDPYAFARQLLTRPEVAAAANRVTAALRFNVPMTQDQLDRLIAGRV